MGKPKHILVIRLSAMGDVAMTVPVLRVLLDTYPDLKITMLSRGFFKPFFKEFPQVDFLEADVYGEHKGILGLIKLAKEAKRLNIDAVADLHQVLRSKVMNTYFAYKALPIARINKGRKEKKAITNAKGGSISPLKTTHQRYADVFGDLGLSIDLNNYHYPPKPVADNKLNGILIQGRKYIGVAPFAAFESKQYPLDKIKEILSRLSKTDTYQVILFGGGEKEITVLEQLASTFENTISIAGKFDFETELNLIAQLDIMVSMDSGNGHLAALFDVPVLTLWGNTHPYVGFTPFAQPGSHQLLADRTQYPLIPTSVYGNKMPEGYEKVMYSIPANIVVDKINEIID